MAFALELPHGWSGRLYRRAAGAVTVHAANYPLVLDDGEFGDRSTAQMPPGGGFLALTEYLPDRDLRPGTGLYARRRLALPLDPAALSARGPRASARRTGRMPAVRDPRGTPLLSVRRRGGRPVAAPAGDAARRSGPADVARRGGRSGESSAHPARGPRRRRAVAGGGRAGAARAAGRRRDGASRRRAGHRDACAPRSAVRSSAPGTRRYLAAAHVYNQRFDGVRPRAVVRPARRSGRPRRGGLGGRLRRGPAGALGRPQLRRLQHDGCGAWCSICAACGGCGSIVMPAGRTSVPGPS